MSLLAQLSAEFEEINPDKNKVILLLKGCSDSDKLGEYDLYDVLHWSCRAGWYDVSKHLIQKYRLDFNENDGEAIPLHFACTSGNIELVAYFITNCSCNEFLVTEDGLTILHCAVMGGFDVVKYVLGRAPRLLDIAQPKIVLFAYNNWDTRLMKYLLVEKNCNVVVDESTSSTLMHSACRDCNMNKLKFLLDECGCNPNVTDDKGDTILHTLCSRLSSYSTDLDIILYLCETRFECDPLVHNLAGFTAVDYSIMFRRENEGVAITRELLLHCPPLDASLCAHILSIAYYYWSCSVINFLITEKQYGIITNIVTGNTVLHNACRDISIMKLRFLVEECHCSPHVVNKKGESLLHTVCRSLMLNSSPSCSFQILQYLCLVCNCHSALTSSDIVAALKCTILQGETDLALVDHLIENYYNRKSVDIADVMSLALSNWDETIMQYLIGEKALDITINSDTGDTVLHKACQNADLIQVKFLLEECKCNPYVVNKNHESLLHTLCRSASFSDKHLNIVSYLLQQYDFDQSARNSKGSTILHTLCDSISSNNYIFCVKALYHLVKNCNCNTNARNRNSFTILHQLCSKCHYGLQVIKLIYHLIKEGKCDPLITDSSFNTVLHILVSTAKQYSPDILSLIHLIIDECGCDISLRNKDGNTVLHLACQNFNGNVSMIQYILSFGKGDLLCPNEHAVTPLMLLYSSIFLFISENEANIHCLINNVTRSSNPIKDSQSIAADVCVVGHLIANYQSKLTRNDFMTFMSLAYSNWHCDLLQFLIITRDSDIIIDNQTGDTVLHKACQNANLLQLKFLLQKCGCSPYVVNKNHESLLHTLCKSVSFSDKHLEIISYLLEQYDFDCNSKCCNNGSTILHTLCDSITSDNCVACIKALYYLLKNYECNANVANNNGLTILHQLCSKLHYGFKVIGLVYHLVKEGKCDANIANKDGFTILHQLCSKCYHGPEVIKLIFYLIKEGKCDPLIKDSDSNTILHILVSTNKKYSPELLSLIYFLIDECGCDISLRNVSGNTPLHLACQYFNGDVSIIEYILSSGKADPLCMNESGVTPLMLLDYSTRVLSAEKKEHVHQLVSRFGEVKLAHPINSFVSIVLLGDPSVGKSTLTKVIKERNDYTLAAQFRNVKGVELRTAGIIPNILNDKDLGRVIIHDLAGHAEYYSSHTAILENLLQGSAAVFIIVVSLADQNFLKSFHRWLAIIENVSHNSFYQCQLLLVVSHIDQPLGNKADSIRLLKQELCECVNDASGLYNHGVFTLDCRKLGGNHLSNLISALSTACQSISKTSTREMSLYCHMIYDFFQRNKQIAICTLEDLVCKTAESNELFLPQDINLLQNIVYTLSTTGLIVYLGNQTHSEKSWVVVDKSILLSDLDGVLFAPSDFEEHVCGIASNIGIVKLPELFSLFPKYDSELLLRFLQYTELGKIITQKFINMLEPLKDDIEDSTNDEEPQYMFIPALIQDIKIPEIEEPFKFGWCLHCGFKKHHFFIPRFLHLLLLHLAYKFSVSASSSNTVKRLCDIWTKGIYWKGTNGVQTLVELDDTNQSLFLLVSCLEEPKAFNEMIKHIKKVITEILICKQQVMPGTVTREYILNNSHLQYPLLQPWSDVSLFDIELLAKCHINNEQFILDTTGKKQLPLAKLFFEQAVNDMDVKFFCEAVFTDRDPKCLAEGDSRVDMVNNQVMRNAEQNFEFQTKNNRILSVMKKYASNIMDLTSNPVKLANDLYGDDLITPLFRDKVIENAASSTYEKSSLLINEVEKTFRGFDRDLEDHFIKFCSVLKQQMSPFLSTIVEEMIDSVSQQ